MPLSYGLNESAIEDNPQWPRYIRITDFDDNNNLREDTFRSINPEKANMYSLQKGDILLARSGATVGKAFCFNESIRACYAGYLIRARLNQKKVLPKYFLYVTKSIHYSEWKKRTNIQSTIQNISAEKYNQYEFPCPTINKQEKVIEYLDTKLSEIDHKVSLLTSKRDAYLRLKKSIINHAVTRGLNPNVKMKDSGIEWIGEVPEHWEVKRMKDICKLSPTIKPYEQYLYCSYLPMEGLRLDNLETSEELVSKLQGKYTPFENGDLLIAKVTPCFENGNIAIAKGLTNGFGFGSSEIFVIRQNKNSCTRILFYMTLSTMFQDKACATMCGVGGLKRISPLFMKSHTIAIPPLPEQHAIATYLDDKCAKIDTIVSNLNKQISRYGDLKRSLIDEVITGKRAV